MINGLAIKNFECWEEAYLEFSPGVNVIIAKPGIKASDCGKSSLIRAIRWGAENQPPGEEIRSHWVGKEETSSTITFPEAIVKRLRTKSKNLYKAEGKEFAAFGKGKVPEEIAELVNFSDLNINLQADSFFLIKETAGEIARYLNRVVNLEEIDSSQTYARSKVTKTRQQVEFLKRQVEKQKEALAEFDWLPEAEKEFTVLKKESQRLAGMEKKLTDLDTLLYRIEEAEKEVSRYRKIPDLRSQIDRLITSYAELVSKERQLNVLGIQLNRIEKTVKEIEQYEKITSLSKQLDQCLAKAKSIRQQEEQISELELVLKRIDEAGQDVKFTARKYEMAKGAFEEAFPQICPLCGQEVKGKQHHD